MKILIVGNVNSAHLVRWVRALQSAGLELVVLSPELMQRNTLLPSCIEVVHLNIPSQHFYYRPPIYLVAAYFFELRSKIRRVNADIVHIHYMPNAFTNCFFWKGISNLVVSVWGSDIVSSNESEKSRVKYYKRALLKQASVVSATTHFLASETAKYGPDIADIRVIPFGIDLDLFCPTESSVLDNKPIRIGYCKSLAAKYNPMILVEAFSEIIESYSNIELVFCGGGDQRQEIVRRAEILELSHNVTFLGPLAYDAIPDLMRSFDIFVMPSISESFGVAAVEAQASGCAVIASDLPGIREAVDANETAILTKVGDRAELVDALVYLILNHEARITMGRKGVKYAQEKFNIRGCVQKFLEIYSVV